MVLPVLLAVIRERRLHSSYLTPLVGTPSLVNIVRPNQAFLTTPLGKTTSLLILYSYRSWVPVSRILLKTNRRSLVESNHDAMRVDLFAPLLSLQTVRVPDNRARREVEVWVVPAASEATEGRYAPFPSRRLHCPAARTFVQDLTCDKKARPIHTERIRVSLSKLVWDSTASYTPRTYSKHTRAQRQRERERERKKERKGGMGYLRFFFLLFYRATYWACTLSIGTELTRAAVLGTLTTFPFRGACSAAAAAGTTTSTTSPFASRPPSRWSRLDLSCPWLAEKTQKREQEEHRKVVPKTHLNTQVKLLKVSTLAPSSRDRRTPEEEKRRKEKELHTHTRTQEISP